MSEITLHYKELEQADDLDHILCLSTLVALKILGNDATLEDANDYHDEKNNKQCDECIVSDYCLSNILATKEGVYR